MELLEFDLKRMESALTLQNYEHVEPIANDLLEKGYSPVKIAAFMFQYGYAFGRKLMRDGRKERWIKRTEERNKPKDENESYSPTSGENEGSV